MSEDHLSSAAQDAPESVAPALPESPLPQPDEEWLHQAGNVAGARHASTGFAPRAGQPRSGADVRPRPARSSRTLLRVLTGVSLAGILVVGYSKYADNVATTADMLGSELVKLVPESAPVNHGSPAPIDPRLADPVSLDLQLLAPRPAAPVAPAQRPAAAEELLSSQTSVQPEPPQALRAAEPAVAPVAPQPPMHSPVSPSQGVSNEELMLRLERVELLLAQLQAQRQAAAPVAQLAMALTTVSEGAAAPAPQAVASPPRPAAVKVKSAAARPAVRSKPTPAAAPAAPAAPALGGQLVSVDMWNGEPSVVVASGLPGDRRVRVLRPGDVVNGLALRSADPVTRSATFAAPGSQGMTLYVNQGG